MKKKLQKIYLTDYNLLTKEDLWQAYYQILAIIFLKEFIKLNINMDTMIKTWNLCNLSTKIATVFLNTKALKII